MTPTEINERTDGPIHGWFGLSYSNYQVLHRTLMQSMPVEWQARAVALFEELHAAYEHIKQPAVYIVEPAEEREYGDLDDLERAALGITRSDEVEDESGHAEEENDEPWEPFFYDRNGDEHSGWERVLVPTGGADPVPHYNRGRTFIEPTGGAA